VGSPEVTKECPACGQPLYGWLEIETAAGPTLLERCENCRLGLAAGLGAADVSNELLAQARRLPNGRLELQLANRTSVQAWLGAQNWAALEPGRGLYPTKQALELLAKKADLSIARLGSPQSMRAQVWMWQTILNAFTFNENFPVKARAGMLRPRGFGDRLKYAVDLLVSVLATPLILVVSIPLEAIAATAGKGGVLVALAAQSSEEYAKVDQ
jgi:hypothetical protein